MSITIGLYRGRHSRRWSSRVLAWWQRCDYSHCAVVWHVIGDTALVSESTAIGGVQTGWRDWEPELWERWVLDVDSTPVQSWWQAHAGQRYDVRALLGFVFRRIKGGARMWLCSEGVMGSIGMPDPWRWDVALVSCYLRRHATLIDSEAKS